jgi:hypothetical protein
MTEPDSTTASRSTADSVAALAVAVGVVLLVLIGFAASYVTLRDLAVSAGRFSPRLAPVVPLSFDLGIVVLSLKVVLAAKQGRSAIWLRLLVSGLSAATVAANASAAATLTGRLLHAIPPAMFVVCFESVTSSARRDALLEAGLNDALPTVRPMLLVLAPLSTARQWRREVLQAQPEIPAIPGRRAEFTSTDVRTAAASSEPVDREMSVHRRAVADSRGNDRDGASRLQCAEAALRADLGLTAVELANALRAGGHACSVRTAQRVKVQALAGIRSQEAFGTEDAA